MVVEVAAIIGCVCLVAGVYLGLGAEAPVTLVQHSRLA